MRRNIFDNIMLVSLFALCGCSNESDISNPDVTGKTPIALSVGVESASTRAVTDGSGKTLIALPENTSIWMAMKSENETASLYCSTIGTAKTTSTAENPIEFTLDNTRFWDDAYGQNAKLSVWALTVPGQTTTPGGKSAAGWGNDVVTTSISWSLSSQQTASTIAAEDLCFSNNIADYSSASPSGSDARMKFGATASGKFDKGKLIFYHALSKVTVILKEGKGFNNSSLDDFNFDSGNVTLKGFGLSNSATFNVTEGEFGTYTNADITSMYKKEKTQTGYTLEALVMPGKSISATSTDDAMLFSIDKNEYKVSAKTLAAALKDKTGVKKDGDNIILEAGKNYVFTFTINKTGIEVTATLAEWTNVEADTYAPKITIDKCYGQETNSNDFGKAFSLYLSEKVADEYAKKADVSATYTLTPLLYWPNHEIHYFFRGIYPEVKTGGTPEGKVSASAIAVANEAYSQGTYPSDLMLGYPRKADGTADETCQVHTSPETKGICADEHSIHMNFQYVMSQVEVKLTTTTGDDKVVLDENTKIEILGGYKSGSIKLEDGTATYTASDKDTYTMLGTVTGNAYDRHDAIIPQSLTNLRFKITVKDSDGKYDSYEATIADIEVTPTGGTKGKISSWQPGKHYTYTLNITKTGIKITATLKDWETTTGSTNIWM